MNLQETTLLINKSLEGLNLVADQCRGEKPGQWTFMLKDSTMWIDVFNFQNDPDRWYIQVMSPLLAMPTKNREAFMQDCLEVNHKLYGCSICKKAEWTYMISLRETKGLDQSELDATIDRVGIYSSDYYSKLSFKFEGSWEKAASTTTTDGPGPK